MDSTDADLTVTAIAIAMETVDTMDVIAIIIILMVTMEIHVTLTWLLQEMMLTAIEKKLSTKTKIATALVMLPDVTTTNTTAAMHGMANVATTNAMEDTLDTTTVITTAMVDGVDSMVSTDTMDVIQASVFIAT